MMFPGPTARHSLSADFGSASVPGGLGPAGSKSPMQYGRSMASTPGGIVNPARQLVFPTSGGNTPNIPSRSMASTPGGIVNPAQQLVFPTSRSMASMLGGVLTCPWTNGSTITIQGAKQCPAVPRGDASHQQSGLVFPTTTRENVNLQLPPPVLPNPAVPAVLYCDFGSSFLCNEEQYSAFGTAPVIVPQDDYLAGYHPAYVPPVAFDHSVASPLMSTKLSNFHVRGMALHKF